MDNDVEVAANIVMAQDGDADRVRRVLDEFEPELSVRILNDIDAGHESYYAIYSFLANLGAVPVRATLSAGSSNSRVRYALPDERTVDFKQIRQTKLPHTCEGCSFNNSEDYKEGYYATRLYVDQQGDYQAGICIQRMDLTEPVQGFIDSQACEDVKTLRREEYDKLSEMYANRITS